MFKLAVFAVVCLAVVGTVLSSPAYTTKYDNVNLDASRYQFFHLGEFYRKIKLSKKTTKKKLCESSLLFYSIHPNVDISLHPILKHRIITWSRRLIHILCKNSKEVRGVFLNVSTRD
uniref:Uncharacterized protein n=1 Tax=Cacopsylla melanoneura TaxID=428564 RepID=A0A8D8VXJ6_9HEMI